MAKKEDYKRMMDLGRWLDGFLSPKLSSYDIKDLADNALVLLGVDHERNENDPVIKALQSLLEEYDIGEISSVHELDTKIEEAINDHSMRAVLAPDFLWTIPEVEKKIKKSDDQTDAERITEKIAKSILPDPLPDKIIEHAISIAVKSNNVMVHHTLYIRDIILVLISTLQAQENTPWSYAISLPAELKGKEIADPLKFLLLHYNNTREILEEDGRKVVFVRRMENQLDDNDYPDYIDFPSLTARIFIDFLREGGKSYCRQCLNCRKFILAERKGRKMYCGDTCRITFNRKEKKEGST